MKPEFTVIIPCLNEEKTIGKCITKALSAFTRLGIPGEVLVIDNGSKDRSIEIATQAGARVIPHHVKGYGSALKRGIEEAHSEFLIMGDADDTYDFSDIDEFIRLLRDGADFVIGTRIKGKIHPGAMPFLHRWLGTPVLTLILNIFFGARISDVNCGLRGFRREAARAMHLRADGMEFASEMVIKAARDRLSIKETPIHYYAPPPDRASHLNSWRDGWRHLRFMLILCPRYLFLIPGTTITGIGLLLILLTLFKTVVIFNMPLGLSTFILAHALFFVGTQILLFGIYASMLSRSIGLIKHDRITNFFTRNFTLERGLAIGASIFGGGMVLVLLSLLCFLIYPSAAGTINLPVTRLAIASIFITLVGMQVIFVSFYLSFFDIDQTLK